MRGATTATTALLALGLLAGESSTGALAHSVAPRSPSSLGAGVDLRHEGCDPLARREAFERKAAGDRRALAEHVQKRSHLEARQLISTGEGQNVAPSGGASVANYKCDPNTCRLPDCHCASTSPPGGLNPRDVPMFITFTADDAVQSYTLGAVNQFLAQRKNPNGCPVPMTYFTSLWYTNYSSVTDWYVAGNEIADHTITHGPWDTTIPDNEISGNLITLNALAGIPFGKIQGFRAPFLNYTADTLRSLARQRFTYDSSSSSTVPVTDPNTDAFWPYTLDNGMANDCTAVTGICSGQIKLNGFWEIPMYATFDDRGAAGPHLMDPWLDTTNGSDILRWMQNTFLDHYNGNKQPFGLYTHPIHLATNYPGVEPPTYAINAINQFLDWATTRSELQNVWLVTNEQLLAWMRNPVPASQLNTLPEFNCPAPNLGTTKICSGVPANEQGLLQHCISDTRGDPLNNSPFYTCYGCPMTTPSPQQPNPPQRNNDGTNRTRIGPNCDTAWWDPIAGRCLCNSASCSFTDATRPIGPNGANLTSSPTTNAEDASASSSVAPDPFRNFNAATALASVQGNANAMIGAAITVLAASAGFALL